jgi:intron-binding protein aquarius
MYKNYPETMSSFALSSVAAVGSPAKLRAHLAGLNEDQLLDVAYRLHLLSRKNASPAGSGDDVPYSRSFLEEIIVSHHALQKNELDGVNALSLYPTEALLWDETVLPLTELAADAVLALPKLNLQFLTFQDYLLRSFTLFRLESAYEIREDITDAVNRIAPKKTYDYSSGVRVEKLEFQGWSRMALPVRALCLHLCMMVPGKGLGSLFALSSRRWEGFT